VGYGLAGAVFHAPLISSTEGMSVAFVVTSDGERSERARVDLPEATVVPRADNLWSRAEELDLVVIAAANHAHAPLAEAALRAGVPVVVDKPLATKAADARRLAELSEETGVMLTVFHNRRWDDDFLTLRRQVEEGTLGPITRFESRFERYRPDVVADRWRESPAPEDGGGVLFDLGSHLIDQALVLFGEPTQVYAEIEQRRRGAQVDDDTFVALRFAGGEIAHLWASQVAPEPGARFRVAGLEGAFESWGLDPQEDALKSGLRPGDAGWGERPGDAEPTRLLPGAYERFYTGVRDALRQGGPPPVSAADGLRVIEVIETARKEAPKWKDPLSRAFPREE
jgi:predicted dehydrogenase